MNVKIYSVWRNLVNAFSIPTWGGIHPFLQCVLIVYATSPLATY